MLVISQQKFKNQQIESHSYTSIYKCWLFDIYSSQGQLSYYHNFSINLNLVMF